MALKYAKKWKLFLFLFISILDSFQSVFLAYLLKYSSPLLKSLRETCPD